MKSLKLISRTPIYELDPRRVLETLPLESVKTPFSRGYATLAGTSTSDTIERLTGKDHVESHTHGQFGSPLTAGLSSDSGKALGNATLIP